MSPTLVAAARRKGLRAKWAGAAVAVSLLAACSGSASESAGSDPSAAESSSGSTAANTSSSSERSDDGGELFDSSVVHDIEVKFDQAEYDAMIAAFRSSGSKEWITATITIDGVTLKNVGLRLKGNSSLMGLRTNNGGRAGGPGGTVSAESPNTLPWLVRLDKNVDGQSYEGYTEFVIRSNNTTTSLNEAVALELIGLTGQATQKAFSTRFSVNGGAEVLRLAIENPADEWDDDNFANDGVLYKAESGGDYSYRGDDPAAYDEIFDQETDTDEENFKPLTEFLKFINTADDATFAAQLAQHLDVAAFAKYLAGQELVANQDDIDGPGNNSYLRYDDKTGLMTIVSWDLNLSFGSLGGGGGAARPATGATPGVAPGAAPGANAQPGLGAQTAPRTGGAGGFNGRSNILVQRFLANSTFSALYTKTLAEMRTQLYGGGAAAEIVSRWTNVLQSQASDLVSATTLAQEAANVSRYFTA
ncbi:MAG: CotH kinase family protein [Acidimicrobiales bacterium]